VWVGDAALPSRNLTDALTREVQSSSLLFAVGGVDDNAVCIVQQKHEIQVARAELK